MEGKNITIHSKPFIDILSRRQPHSFPKVSTAESGIYVLSELRSLQTERKVQAIHYIIHNIIYDSDVCAYFKWQIKHARSEDCV